MNLKKFLFLMEDDIDELKGNVFRAIDILSKSPSKDFRINPPAVRDLKDFINKYSENTMEPFILRQINSLIRMASALARGMKPDLALQDEANGIIQYANDYGELASNEEKIRSVKKIKDREEVGV